MKYFKITILLFALSITSCSAQNFNKIIYKAHTRGSAVEIEVQGNKITYQTTQNKKALTLSKEQLNRLNDIIGAISLKEIQTLKAPTNERYSDGALIANFIIKVKDKEYTSSTFDAGNPPKELKKLEDLLSSLIKSKE